MNMKQDVAPIYLIASERSGTNLFRKLLTQHQRQYFGPPPAHFLKHLYYNVPYYEGLITLNERSFATMVQDALSLCYTHWSPWEINLDVDSVIAGYKRHYDTFNSVLLAHYLMKRYAESKGYKSYLCKDNHIFDFVFEILHFLPTAKFIYLHRDPRDVALSQKKRTLQTDSIRKIAKLWRDEQIKSLACLTHLESGKVLRITYENLIAEPEQELEKVCSFLNVRFIRKPLMVKTMTGAVVIKEWENLDKPIMKDNFNKYKDGLSWRELMNVESVVCRQLAILGYERETEPKRVNLFYRFYDELILDLVSWFRRRFMADKRDRWAKRRKELTAELARRRLG